MTNYFEECKTKEDLLKAKTRLVDEIHKRVGKEIAIINENADKEISIINSEYSKAYMKLRSTHAVNSKNVPVTYISESLKLPEVVEGYNIVYGVAKSNQIIVGKDGTIYV